MLAFDRKVLDIELGDGPTGIDLALILRRNIPEPRVVGLDNRSRRARQGWQRL